MTTSKVRPRTGETPSKSADPNGTSVETLMTHESIEMVNSSFWYAVKISAAGTKVDAAFDADGNLLLGPCDALYASDVDLVTMALYDTVGDTDLAIPLAARSPTPIALMQLTSNTADLWALWHRKPSAQAKETT